MFDFVVASLEKGGWVLLPIYLCSLWGWALVVNIFFRLRDLHLPGRICKSLMQKPSSVKAWLQSPKSKRYRHSAGYLALRLLNRTPKNSSQEYLEDIQEEATRYIRPQLEKGLSTLMVLAAIAPLLGLLGTVTGMVTTFRVIGAFGTSNPALMADSIAEALMTTQNGLMVAFPLLLIHVFLLNYSTAIEQDAEQLATGYLEYLQAQNTSSEAA